MACADCIAHQVGSSEFMGRLASISSPERDFPLAGSIELTLRCNVRCKHCYILYPGATNDEMSTEQVKHVLDRLQEKGVLFLLMTGGEIFTRCDFEEIYLYAKQLGFIITLFTNATLIDEKKIAFLKKWPPRRVEITIYGHTEKTYEAVTGMPGSFRRFRNGIDLLLKNNLPIYLKTIVLETNKHEYEDVKAWVLGLGVPFRDDAIVNPKLDGNTDPLRERISPEDVVRIQGADDKAREEVMRLRKMAENSGPDGRLFKCGAGIRTFHIDPKGHLHPCMMWRSTPYDLLNENGQSTWQDHIESLRTGMKPEDSKCTACPNTLSCGNCAATSLLETGVAGKNVDYYCKISEARIKILSLEEFAAVPDS